MVGFLTSSKRTKPEKAPLDGCFLFSDFRFCRRFSSANLPARLRHRILCGGLYLRDPSITNSTPCAVKVLASLRRDDTFVFSFKSHSIRYMLNTGWRTAREKTGLPHVRVHDLKHTFGRRLRAAGVSLEDRQDLLGHRSGKITTHYSAAELSRLIEYANSVCDRDGTRPELVILRGALHGASRKTPARPRFDLARLS